MKYYTTNWLDASTCLGLEQLPDFEIFCTARGWTKVPTVGEWEILRMQPKDGGGPMIVHKKARHNLITFHGESMKLAEEYYNETEVRDYDPDDQ